MGTSRVCVKASRAWEPSSDVQGVGRSTWASWCWETDLNHFLLHFLATLWNQRSSSVALELEVAQLFKSFNITGCFQIPILDWSDPLPRCGWRLVTPSARRTTLRLASRRLTAFGIDSLLLNTKLQDTWHAWGVGLAQPFKSLNITGSYHVEIPSGALIETLQACSAMTPWVSCNTSSTQDHTEAGFTKSWHQHAECGFQSQQPLV